MQKFISVYKVTPLLKRLNVSYEYTRVSGLPFLKICLCEADRILMSELKELKISEGKALPIIYT